LALLDRPFAALYDRINAANEQKWLGEARRQMLEGRTGNILEIGAGTGANFPYYSPQAQVTAIEPSPHFFKRARRKIASSPATINLEVANAQELPFADNTFDASVATLVFCTIPDPLKALVEIQRVTRPCAPLLMIEHVQPSTPGKRLLLNLWNPCQKVLAGGCNVNRDTEATVRDAGWRVDEVRVLIVELGIAPQLFIRATNVKGS
jgi:ubiquinone/menaquinone biosynthesis C-methylase UbiE